MIGLTRSPNAHDGDRLMAARVILMPGLAGAALGLAAGVYRAATSSPGPAAFLGAVAGGALVGVGLGGLGWLLIGRTSQGVISLLTAAGNLPPAPSFSLQESLIVRGRFSEAATAFRDHLKSRPDDDHAKLALAALLARHLADPKGAEELLQGVARDSRDPHLQFAASNALIDHFRALGAQGRLMTELARFADRYRGLAAANAAKRELDTLKEAVAAESSLGPERPDRIDRGRPAGRDPTGGQPDRT